MPRKKVNYTHEYPYHVHARSNNKENFYLDIENVWNIFYYHLNELKIRFNCEIHAFVLMSNHYHLLLNTSEKFNLGQVMHWFQMSVSRSINSETGRVNHVFGGPYRCSQIIKSGGFEYVFKYIYRNPIRAGLCNKVEDYRFSLLNRDPQKLAEASSLLEGLIFSKEWLNWINVPTQKEHDEIIKKALARSVYNPCARSLKKLGLRN